MGFYVYHGLYKGDAPAGGKPGSGRNLPCGQRGCAETQRICGVGKRSGKARGRTKLRGKESGRKADLLAGTGRKPDREAWISVRSTFCTGNSITFIELGMTLIIIL